MLNNVFMWVIMIGLNEERRRCTSASVRKQRKRRHIIVLTAFTRRSSKRALPRRTAAPGDLTTTTTCLLPLTDKLPIDVGDRRHEGRRGHRQAVHQPADVLPGELVAQDD